MTFFSAARFIDSSFSRRCVSTNGPFFNNLDISIPLFLSPLHDELVGRLPVSRFVPLGLQAPRRPGIASARGLAFPAAERVIDRVHRDAAHAPALAEPAAADPLAARHVLV